MRIISLNLNGIRAAAKKGFYPWLEAQQADIVCLQELKAQTPQLEPDPQFYPEAFHHIYHHAEKKGYSGVGLYSRVKPDQVVIGTGLEDIDAEGRFIRADFGTLTVISVYLPSGSSKSERQDFKYTVMDRFLPLLESIRAEGQEVIVCGDINIAHTKKDIKNWRSNQKNSGFLPEERAWMDQWLKSGWIDTFREIEPDAERYTWWSNRGKAWDNDTGWRIDYQIATSGFKKRLQSAAIYRDQRFSDHAPLTIDYDMNFEEFN